MAILLLTAGAVAAHAGAAAGAESFDFLLLDPSARAVGLGGAYTALAADSNALFYNPAGLGRIKANEVTFMHNQHVQGLTQEYVGLATLRGWGLNVNYLNFGGVRRTRVDAPDGGSGSAGMTDIALGGGYGRALSDSISVGAGAKFARETIDDASAAGFAVDAGVLVAVRSLPGLSLGAALLNVGPGVRFQSRRENPPRLGRAGAAFSFRANRTVNTVAFDATKAGADKVRFGFGAESIYEKILAIRVGFSVRNGAGFGIAGGVGFLWKALGVDYAIVPFGDLGVVNRLSLTFRWGSAAKRSAPRAIKSAPRKEQKAAADETAPVPLPAENENLRRVRDNEKMGTSSYHEGDCSSAKNYFARAIRAATAAAVEDPAVANAYAGMGRCLIEEESFDDAAKFFKALEEGASAETRRLVEEELETLRPR